MDGTSTQLTTARVPAFNSPPGTQMHILNLGILQADEGLRRDLIAVAENKLLNAIEKASYDIKDIKGMIMGHLYVDQVGVCVHGEEFKHACWAVATGADIGVYLGDYLKVTKLNLATFAGELDIWEGITLHYAPGHTLGLCVRSSSMINRLQRLFNATLIYGHDMEVTQGLIER
ncbi:hypothetical protein F5884DRAFT_817272 [Xylogone sp. PMI_703]|nr:hypothetical protein F5884DRAFT_817272 [Xylogone sp. PMI_703]